MSSIFSDPFFRRGTTLLGGEAIELDGDSIPIAGGEIVGQIKAFQDVNPSTGARNSNRLVYCVAARYKGSSTTGASLAGKLVAFDTGKANASMTEFSAAATATNVADGRAYGVVDEYIPSGVDIRQNDIVWVVVKGPVTVLKTAGASGSTAYTAGLAAVVSATAGSVTYKGDATSSTGTVMIGQHTGATANVASATTTIRINLWSDQI
jgi:hypothetical protein